MAAAILSRKKARQTAELQARFADKPWMLRADWAAGKIKSSALSQSQIYLIMALGFCGIGGIGTAFAVPDALHKHSYGGLMVLIFPLIGILFLAAFIKARLARARYGDCFFEMAQVPAPLGGSLDGMIQTGARLKPEHGLHLKLSCIRRVVTGYGKNRSTSESVLWQDEKVFRPEADLPEPAPGHTGIPVYFKLPDGQPQCFTRGDVSVYWRLEAKAKMPGPDFVAAFDVPVFHVAGAVAEAANEPDPTAALQMPIEELRRDEHSKIQVTDGPNGREFYFPPARNVGTALFTTLFMLIFNGIAALTFHLHAPVLFPIAFGLFGVLMLCGVFSLWFKSSRVTIDSTRVRATNRYLIFSRTRQFSTGDVARFAAIAGMQSGSTIFYNLKLITRNSDADPAPSQAQSPPTSLMPALQQRASHLAGVTIASGLADLTEANWLVQEMTKALGRGA